jgi:hypothetical protein
MYKAKSKRFGGSEKAEASAWRQFVFFLGMNL